MDVIHFPDDPRPLAVVAAGARARQFRRRASRPPQDSRARAPRRRRARRDVGGHDLRPASAARRPARQGAAAADDQGAEARGDRGAGVQGAAIVRFTPRAVAVGSRRRSCARCWSTGCASSEVWVGANFLFGHDRAGNFSLLRDARRALRLQGREDRSGPLQGLRRQQHARSGGWSARGAWTKRARCSATSTSSTARSSAAISAAGRIGFPTANLCTENELLPPHGVYATTATDRGDRLSVGDQHRRPADRRPVRARRRSRRTSSTWIAICTARRIRVGFVQRLRDERAFESLDAAAARRSTPTAGGRACCSIGFHCRIARRVRPRFPLRPRAVRASGAFDAMLGEVAARGVRARRLPRARPIDELTGARCARRCRAGTSTARRALRRAVRARSAGELEIVVSCARRRRLADLLRRSRRAMIHDAPVQHADPQRENLRARPGQHRPDVHLRPDRLRARPHRQLPHVRLRRRAAPHAEVTCSATQVHQVMNFTDVDDRTIAGAQKAGMELRAYTDQYIAAFREDARGARARAGRGERRARPTRRTCGRWPS